MCHKNLINSFHGNGNCSFKLPWTLKLCVFPFILSIYLHSARLIDIVDLPVWPPLLWIRVVPNSLSSESCCFISRVSDNRRKILVRSDRCRGCLVGRGCKRTSGVIKTIEACLWPVRLHICVLPDKSRSPRVPLTHIHAHSTFGKGSWTARQTYYLSPFTKVAASCYILFRLNRCKTRIKLFFSWLDGDSVIKSGFNLSTCNLSSVSSAL